ncbi:MAG TPA: hypothetical protein DCP26_10290 [Brevundimonas sp.]|nr:hypothetical protein [Brevundimonas sp.]
MVSDQEQRLAQAWRAHFRQPLPILGAADIVEQILIEHGAIPSRVQEVADPSSVNRPKRIRSRAAQ